MLKAAVITVVVVALIWWAAPYIIAVALAGGIVHKAGKLRREAHEREERQLYMEALRALPYNGVNNPDAPAWFDRGRR